MPNPMARKTLGRINRTYWKHEGLGRATVTVAGLFLSVLTLLMAGFLAVKGLSTFLVDHRSPLEFLFSTKWSPDADTPAFGALIFIVGSILLSTLALLISTPFSLSTAVFVSEISPDLGRNILQPAIEIFVGIPSVVYGWIGLSVLVPFIRRSFGGLGFSLLAGSLVLALMIFPTIASLSADAFRALPADFREASYALGATRWQTIRKVLLPAAMPGILTGVVLGLARAFGEALAVQMVIGNMIRIPGKLTDATVNLTSIITMDMGNTATGTPWNDVLWSMALLLLMISFLFILLARTTGQKRRSLK